jgi:Fe-S-cluster containining protein
MKNKSITFHEFNKTYPCDSCGAPCCQYLLIPYKTPTTWIDIDFVKYLLNFPNVNITVSKQGTWAILINQNCQHLDKQTLKCKVHDTPQQPKTCSYYNPYQCNYRINLDTTKPNSIYLLTRDNFDGWAEHLRFDEAGFLVAAPNYEQALEILSGNDAPAGLDYDEAGKPLKPIRTEK